MPASKHRSLPISTSRRQEIEEPKYCDVIVERWETLTGKKATIEKV